MSWLTKIELYCPTLLIVCAILTACTSVPEQTGMMRVCDSSGCSDRPRDSASYNPSAAIPNDDP